jgi:NADH-quinone oxidoreductase subunit D
MLCSVYNFGPNHPSAHGVLRLIIYVIGEIVLTFDLELGLLHRSTEKLIEFKVMLLGCGLFDRLDYVSCFSQELIYYRCFGLYWNCY